MHLIVYFNPRILELGSQIDRRRQVGKRRGLVLLVPRSAPIVLKSESLERLHFGESKLEVNSKMSLTANGTT